MNTMDLINRTMSQPMTHVVLTTYLDGTVKRFDVRSLAAAQNYATGERHKIGRKLISRNADLTDGPIVEVVSVEVAPIA